jgi:hypothetical protein
MKLNRIDGIEIKNIEILHLNRIGNHYVAEYKPVTSL